MQKIRHCCQNLNLLPYLLYSFDHSKSHPVAVKVNIYLNIMVNHLLQNMVLLYAKLQWSILRSLSSESQKAPKEAVRSEKKERVSRSSFHKEVIAKPKQKQTPIYLVLVIYLAPLLVACQLAVVCCLLALSKYTPGFTFLVCALMFLGLIFTRTMFHDSVAHRQTSKKKTRKSKVE